MTTHTQTTISGFKVRAKKAVPPLAAGIIVVFVVGFLIQSTVHGLSTAEAVDIEQAVRQCPGVKRDLLLITAPVSRFELREQLGQCLAAVDRANVLTNQKRAAAGAGAN